MDEELEQGVLDGFLAPFGQELTNPGGAVTDMLGYTEPAPVAAPVQQAYAAPAPVDPGTARTGLSSWNPFTLLFGDPNNPNKNGALMGGGQPEPTNFAQFTQNAEYNYGPGTTDAQVIVGDADQKGARPVQQQGPAKGVPTGNLGNGRAWSPENRPSYAIQAPGPGSSMFANPTGSYGPLPGSQYYQGDAPQTMYSSKDPHAIPGVNVGPQQIDPNMNYVQPNTMSNVARQLVGRGWKFPLFPPQAKR